MGERALEVDMLLCHNLRYLDHDWDGCSFQKDFHLVGIFLAQLKAVAYHNDGQVLRLPEAVHHAQVDFDLLASEHARAQTAELVGVANAADCVVASGALSFLHAGAVAGAFSLFGTRGKIHTWAN